MIQQQRRRERGIVRAIIVLVVVALAIVAVVLFVRARQKPKTVATPSTQPATAPATQPTTAASKPPPKSYMDVVLATYPGFPTTQPLGVPLDLREAARLVINEPIYLDSYGQLWVTRADAEPVAAVLKRAAKEQTHVVREHVVFVHRWPDAKGVWQPQLVCRRDDGGYELVSLAGRQDMLKSYDYDWSRAFSWNESIVVSTTGGISVLRPDRRPMELHHAFYPPGERPENLSPTQALLDWRGLLAWMAWEHGKTGSRGAARFIDEKWQALDASKEWPEKIMHLIPLLDGGVIQLYVEEHDEYAMIQLAILDPAADVDEAKIVALVQQLSHEHPDRRTEAFNELTRYGQGVWPLLEKLKPDQLPEAQVRIEQLLAAKIEPTLGGMKLMPGKVKMVTRSKGGAALLYAGGGVEVPRVGDDPEVVAPAWLAILPGRSVTLAHRELVADLVPETARIDIVSGELILTDDVHGPRWWLANHFSEPLLKKPEFEFKHVVGQDARGRWLFRKGEADRAPTLVIDPTLPDPTPRLPVWRFHVENGEVGWTVQGWPVIRSGGAWVLGESDWRPLDPKREKMLVEDESSPAPPPVITTSPTTSPATSPTTAESEPPVFTDKDGTRYYDGLETLHVVKPDGTRVTWPLPDNARGTGIVWLLRAGDDRLFLFNEPGRVLRIKPTPGGPEPFELEATFTRRIPSDDNFQRVWLDPAGRIVIAHDIDTLSILFPKGLIPPDIARKIPAAELRESEGE